MNEAERLMREIYGEGAQVNMFGKGGGSAPRRFAPDVEYSLFGPSGTKEMLVGAEAVNRFIGNCRAALAAHSDEIVTISSIGDHCAFVHARAYRKSAASGEEARYEWATLVRVEDGRITYCTDMLDPAAQAFWGRIDKAG